MIDLICSVGKSLKFSQIAENTGWMIGAQMGTVYAKIDFVDLNFKKGLDIEYLTRYAKFVQTHRPKYATLPDLIQWDDFDAILDYGQKYITNFVQFIIIIPKVCEMIERIPVKIDDTPVVLGYSVPTRYGATSVPEWEFLGRPVHLLGGSPRKQFILYHYFDNVVSADSNMMQKMATRHCGWFNPSIWNYAPPIQGEGMLKAFERSCVNIRNEWLILCGKKLA